MERAVNFYMRQKRNNYGTGNLLLELLPFKTWSKLKHELRLTYLQRGDVLVEPGRAPHVFFPCDAVIAKTVEMQDGLSVEAGIVGRDGMVPLCVFLGLVRGPYRAVVYVPGHAWCLSATAFRRLLPVSPDLQFVLMRFTAAFLSQLSVLAACNQYHSLLSRFSRRLLMLSRRLGTWQIPMTQAHAAQSLGVRRMSIGEVIGQLEAEGIIESRRGLLIIRRPKKLEQRACECYHRIEQAYQTVNLQLPDCD